MFFVSQGIHTECLLLKLIAKLYMYIFNPYDQNLNHLNNIAVIYDKM